MGGYKSGDIQFPFNRVEAPETAIEVTWTINELLNFFRTWSAYKLMQGTPDGTEINALFSKATTQFEGVSLPLRMPIYTAAGHVV